MSNIQIKKFAPEILQNLQDTKDLLQTKRWSKGAFARDNLGGDINFASENAESFGLIGALKRVCWDKGFVHYNDTVWPTRAALSAILKGADTICFNDNQTSVEPVLAKIDEAIAYVRNIGEIA